jgi:hypothetical protein
MTKTHLIKSNLIILPHWDASFWFAVLSPVLGVLAGMLFLLLFHD